MQKFLTVIVTLLVVAALGAGGLYYYQLQMQKQGKPVREVEIPGTDIHVKLPREMGPEGVSKVIYLNREGAWLLPGADEAPRNRSSIIKNAGLERVKIPAFTGSHRGWNAIVKCIRSKLAPFDVEVVDTRPVDRDYTMAVFGGKADLVGRPPKTKRRYTSGLAPFSGGSIRSAVVLVFSQALRNNTREVCDVASHEIAHTYGLDHAYNCRDLMTYLKRCIKSRTFANKDVSCGEFKRRPCKGGEPKQNTYQRLVWLLGARPQPVAARSTTSKKRTSRAAR
jgi:hypothetical protein